MRNPVRPVAATVLLLVMTVTGCSSDGGSHRPSAGPSGSPSSSAPAPPLTTTATIGHVVGSRLSTSKKRHLKSAVTKVVDGWLDAAYVGGHYPRSDFGDAFPGFTSRARKDAVRDQRLMSNADIGPRISGVTATKRRLRIDVLAVHGRAAGVTARFVLDFSTSGHLHKHPRVGGRLLLTRTSDGWRIFGYHVTKGGAR